MTSGNVISTTEYRGYDIDEVEVFTEEDYDEMLDDCFGPVRVGSLEYSASHVLKKVDPIAYRCGFSDYQEYRYISTLDGEEYETEQDAKDAIDAFLAEDEE